MSRTTQLDENAAGARRPSRASESQHDPAAIVEACCVEALDKLLVQSHGIDANLRSIAISGIGMAAGTSTVAINLAVAASRRRGRRVALVELNDARPVLASAFHVEPGPGVLALAAGQTDLPDCVRSTVLHRLHLLPIGGDPRWNVGAIDAQRMADCLEMLQETYDLVILDMPPVHEMAQRWQWVRNTGGIVLVVDASSVTIEQVQQTGDRLRRSEANFLGTVLNKC